MQYLIGVFVTVLLAELGDKTQLAVLLFATRPEASKLGIMAAASGALLTATLIAVLIGDRLGQWINPKILEPLAGVLFIIIGSVLLISGLRGAE